MLGDVNRQWADSGDGSFVSPCQLRLTLSSLAMPVQVVIGKDEKNRPHCLVRAATLVILREVAGSRSYPKISVSP